jgi:putative transposase
MTKSTLQNVVINKPEPTIKSKQHMCMDKGYDYPEVYELLEDYGYTIHVRLRGEERSRRRYQNIEPDAGLLKEHIHG